MSDIETAFFEISRAPQNRAPDLDSRSSRAWETVIFLATSWLKSLGDKDSVPPRDSILPQPDSSATAAMIPDAAHLANADRQAMSTILIKELLQDRGPRTSPNRRRPAPGTTARLSAPTTASPPDPGTEVAARSACSRSRPRAALVTATRPWRASRIRAATSAIRPACRRAATDAEPAIAARPPATSNRRPRILA